MFHPMRASDEMDRNGDKDSFQEGNDSPVVALVLSTLYADMAAVICQSKGLLEGASLLGSSNVKSLSILSCSAIHANM